MSAQSDMADLLEKLAVACVNDLDARGLEIQSNSVLADVIRYLSNEYDLFLSCRCPAQFVRIRKFV